MTLNERQRAEGRVRHPNSEWIEYKNPDGTPYSMSWYCAMCSTALGVDPRVDDGEPEECPKCKTNEHLSYAYWGTEDEEWVHPDFPTK